MTIRYVRDGLRVVRLQTVADLTALHHQAAAVQEQARDFKRRVHALREGLLADHRRRERLEHRASLLERAAAPHVEGTAVRQARLRAGLSQRELARDLGLPRSCVAMAEAGQRVPSPRLARWAAGVLRASGSRGAEGEGEGEAAS